MESLSKSKIKLITSLQQKKFRDQHGLFVIEGVKMVEEALRSVPELIEYCISTPNYKLPASFSTIEQFQCDERTLNQCSSLQTPNKVLLVLKKMTLKAPDSNLTVVIDGIQDPGNFGTIMRLADWFGISRLVCSTKTVDVYNPKVVQATMGAILRIDVEYCDLPNYLKNQQIPIYGALMEGENIYSTSLSQKAILVMGNEGAGISKEVLPFISNPITIPRFGVAESLNVAVATGILLSEFKRTL